MGERLTLVVFKDHLSSRTLTVRLGWLRAFAFGLLSVIGLTIVAGALFFSAYRKAITSNSMIPSLRLEELEKEAAEARAAYEAIKSQALTRAETSGSPLAGASHSFSLLPSEAVLEKLPAPETLPFRLEPLKGQWKGSTLQIRSAIEYTKEGGNQQGHFVILARGAETLLAYPDGVFDTAGSSTLLKPESGEFFSVSRYREIKADFGPFTKRDNVKSIEIFIFDLKKRLIFLDRIGLETAVTTPSAPSSPKKSESAPENRPSPTAQTEDTSAASAPVTIKPAAPTPTEQTEDGI